MTDRKTKIVISDFHIGGGHKKGAVNYYDEFTYDDEFYEFLDYYSSGEYEPQEVELIINGDFFDMIKVSVDGKYPDKITEAVAINKLKQCLDGHPKVEEGLKMFASRPNKSITYMPGNHDIDMIFPAAAKMFKERLTSPENRDSVNVITDRDSIVLEGGVHVHHGHQFEANNSFDYANILVKKSLTGANLEEPFIRIPWGTLFLLKVIIPLKNERFFIDHIRPFNYYVKWGLIYDTFFTLKLVAKGAYYWLKTRLNLLTQPGLPFSKGFQKLIDTIIFYPSLENYASRILKRTRGVHTVIMGHDHYERCRSYGEDKLYINTGTWVKMISLDAPHIGESLRRPYALVEYAGKETTVTLMDWHGSYKICTPIRY